MINCPICKGTGKLPDLEIRLSDNLVFYKGQKIMLTPREAEVLSIIYAEGPLGIYDIVDQVYANQEPRRARTCVSIFIMNLRARLKPFGLTISNLRSERRFTAGSYILSEAP